jgi:hypothetical protein
VINEQWNLFILGQMLSLGILVAFLIAMNFRGSGLFRRLPALIGGSAKAEMTTAKLPPELRVDSPRTISGMKSGETGHAAFTDFCVSENGDCFLRAGAKLREKLVNTIEVRRDEVGYNVVIPANIKYTPGPILLIDRKLPVASIMVGPTE